jgi:hypothetical protein
MNYGDGLRDGDHTLYVFLYNDLNGLLPISDDTKVS